MLFSNDSKDIDLLINDAVQWRHRLKTDEDLININIDELSVDPTRFSLYKWRSICKREAIKRRDIGLIRGIGQLIELNIFVTELFHGIILSVMICFQIIRKQKEVPIFPMNYKLMKDLIWKC